jgi:hypothetical protein
VNVKCLFSDFCIARAGAAYSGTAMRAINAFMRAKKRYPSRAGRFLNFLSILRRLRGRALRPATARADTAARRKKI